MEGRCLDFALGLAEWGWELFRWQCWHQAINHLELWSAEAVCGVLEVGVTGGLFFFFFFFFQPVFSAPGLSGPMFLGDKAGCLALEAFQFVDVLFQMGAPYP